MTKLRSICVYCGSSNGTRPEYVAGAERLGRDMAAGGIRLVYGGGNVGLMGTVARAVIENGGQVTGIIPTFLQRRERMLTEVEELIVTKDMHERKRLMFERADAFVALPGGVGTLEELVEQLTWAQLGQHKKPIVLVNIDGFWTRFLDILDHMREEGFIRPETAVDVLVANTPEEVVPMITAAIEKISRAEMAMNVAPETL
ncbi:TIGR00730 family Rossman fold protein [Labrys sp. LIt4]|uniref:Cytokinin riboside 5'-monophosphate phosphoribohydrolase n=1 Tax=Labrys okinawensis TaxID=346911 RepID=A0A2S9QG09_9HYPH|nr:MULTISPECIES: TIGR00730 family Rossman fold protein [Labrys]MBP0578447.1 TIGR00730 family Rossman fold protein [Labrys sp. LIt4]PRH88230.1 TIGR00730 family Rossman fold protein [Labrys okinawensis]